EADVAWIGYANDALRRTVEPVLIGALRRRGLLSPVWPMRVRPLDELRASADAELLAPMIARVRAMPDVARSGAPLYFARAPGRLDVMGGIADYSGSLGLQLPLAVATTVTLWPIDERAIHLLSVPPGARPRRLA